MQTRVVRTDTSAIEMSGAATGAAHVDAAGVACWTITDGAAGQESQCRGLAEALGVAARLKRVRRRLPQAFLPPHWLPPGMFVDRRGDDTARIAPPWPALLISCGHTAAAYAIAIRNLSGGRSFTVHIQNPRVPFRLFDLIVAPAHDRVSGANVIVTHGAIHGVTPERLADAARRFGPALRDLPRPRVAVLVGGPSRHFRFGAAEAEHLCDRLAVFAAEHGAGLAVTVSRRTGEAATAVLRRRFGENPGARLWDGTGENPYLGYLALADALVVTSDSISMISEACATGKPVYAIDLPGRGASNLRRFLDEFIAAGRVRRFDGRLDRWDYALLDEARRAAGEIRTRFASARLDGTG